MPPPQMTILNAPTREACVARRERTNTPLQALLLMNEPEFVKAARHLAHAGLVENPVETAACLNFVYETITGRLPDAAESARCLTMLAELEALYVEDEQLAGEMCADFDRSKGISKAELAAWTMLVSAIQNLDITRTRD